MLMLLLMLLRYAVDCCCYDVVARRRAMRALLKRRRADATRVKDADTVTLLMARHYEDYAAATYAADDAMARHATQIITRLPYYCCH